MLQLLRMLVEKLRVERLGGCSDWVTSGMFKPLNILNFVNGSM